MGVASVRDRRFKINEAYKKSVRTTTIKAASRGLLGCVKCKADREGRHCNKAHNRSWVHCKRHGSQAWLSTINSEALATSKESGSNGNPPSTTPLVLLPPDAGKWKQPTRSELDTFLSTRYTTAIQRGLPDLSAQPRLKLTSWSVADVQRLFQNAVVTSHPRFLTLPPNLAADPTISPPRFHQAFSHSYDELHIGVVEVVAALIESVELTEFLILPQPDQATSSAIHETFGVHNPPQNQATPTSKFRPENRLVPNLVVGTMSDLLVKWNTFDLPFDPEDQLHYTIPPPTKVCAGGVAKPIALTFALSSCKLYLVDLVRMRSPFLPNGVLPCANSNCPKPHPQAQYWGVTHLGAGGITRILRADGFFDFITSVHRVCLTCGTTSYDHAPAVLSQLPLVLRQEIDMDISTASLSSTMLTRSCAHALRLFQTRQIGASTFSTTAHNLAIRTFTEREGEYYSMGLEYLHHLEVCLFHDSSVQLFTFAFCHEEIDTNCKHFSNSKP